jgi:hypothetical protein
MLKRIMCFSGTVTAFLLLSAHPLGWCMIACTATACLLALVYTFGPQKQSDRTARLLRLPPDDRSRARRFGRRGER